MTATYVQMSDGSYAEQVTDPTVANITSATDANTVSAPGAGVSICSTAVLAPGVYDVEAVTFIGGTTVATVEATNMRLVAGAAAIARIVNPVPGTAGATGLGEIRVRIVTTTSVAIGVVAVAAATAGAVYSASVVAKRVA